MVFFSEFFNAYGAMTPPYTWLILPYYFDFVFAWELASPYLLWYLPHLVAEGGWWTWFDWISSYLLEHGSPFGPQDLRYWPLWQIGPSRIVFYYQHLVPTDVGWRIQLRANTRLKRQWKKRRATKSFPMPH